MHHLHTTDSLPVLEKSMQVVILPILAKIKVYYFKRPYSPLMLLRPAQQLILLDNTN